MRNPLAAITVGFTLLMGATSASAVPLYQYLLTPSQTPDQLGWVKLFTNIAPAPAATATPSGTILNTGNIANSAGYLYNYQQVQVKLNRTTGYSISFSVKIKSESHSNNNSAGFSIIVNSDTSPGETQPYGIKLAFWQDRVWAQDSLFNHAEGVSFNNQLDGNTYNLYVKDDQYQLFANGSTTPILQGKLRQYPPRPELPVNPYNKPNLILIGDTDTTATAEVTIKNVYATPAGTNTTGGKLP